MCIRDIWVRVFYTFVRAWSISWFFIFISGVINGWQGIYFDAFYAILIISVLISLTYFVLYSKNELGGTKLIIRFCIHFLLVLGIVVSVPYFMGQFEITLSIVALIIFSSVAYFLVALYEWFIFLRLANKINQKLKTQFK
ncbi:MAG: hypothetical protein FWE11_03765 [Defluviitaleaceae bacterium]|nr:hypothetical protein [Defluviitaleaceae bacterium]